MIPEDFRKDQYILKPIIEAMLERLGKPRAKVLVCSDPLLGGVRAALNWVRIREILDRYRGMVDVFVHIVDRDGQTGRRRQLDALERKAEEHFAGGPMLVSENAWQEVEVWVLAGHDDLPPDWQWTEVRLEPNPKERYFVPYARRRGVAEGPGEGRKTLASQAAKRYDRIRRLCQEDVMALEERLRGLFSQA